MSRDEYSLECSRLASDLFQIAIDFHSFEFRKPSILNLTFEV